MKKIEIESAPRPAGARLKIAAVCAACLAVMAVSIWAGYRTAPEDVRLPVLLANGEVIMQPCYVAVEGECIALVENETAAQEVVDRVKDEYKNASTTKIEIEEETCIEKLELENGSEKPEILTVREASKEIVNNKSLTVKTTEVIEEETAVEFETIEQESGEMDLGDMCIRQQGQEGLNRVTKKVIKENGVVVSEDVLEEVVVKECVPEIIISGTAGMAEPLDAMDLTSPFGYRWGRQHQGVDLGAAEGCPIYAAKAGTVIWSGYTEGYGNLIKLDHGDGTETYYAHCSRLDAAEGQQVEAGQQIAAVGSTGNSTGPHLHFEVRVDGEACDPAEYLDLG